MVSVRFAAKGENDEGKSERYRAGVKRRGPRGPRQEYNFTPKYQLQRIQTLTPSNRQSILEKRAHKRRKNQA